MSAFPNRISINGLEYDTAEVADLRDPYDPDKECLGTVSFTRLTIRVDESSPHRLKAATLWHEILHAALYQSGLEPEDEEQIVIALGYTLSQVIRDNPALIAYTRDAP